MESLSHWKNEKWVRVHLRLQQASGLYMLDPAGETDVTPSNRLIVVPQTFFVFKSTGQEIFQGMSSGLALSLFLSPMWQANGRWTRSVGIPNSYAAVG